VLLATTETDRRGYRQGPETGHNKLKNDGDCIQKKKKTEDTPHQKGCPQVPREDDNDGKGGKKWNRRTCQLEKGEGPPEKRS